MKKIISLILALMMIFSLATVASADEAERGSITINGVVLDEKGELGTRTYEIYKLLDLESYDTVSGAYSYKVNSAWASFFASDAAKPYFAVDSQGYATWIAGTSEDAVAAFAKAALAYAQANTDKISVVKSTTVEGDFTLATDPDTGKPYIKFADLDMGYYLIDSNVGALCGLTTTNPDASVNAKNGAPTIDKQVEEDSTNQYGGSNTAEVGQTVNFRTTINVHAGAQDYVLHDAMSEGLDFTGVTKIEHVVPGADTTTVDKAEYSVVENPTGCAMPGCSFEIRFTQAFCDKLETNDKVIVYYTATLNEKAVVAGNGNKNESVLEYGDHFTSTKDTTQTYTYGFDIVKTDSQNKLIDGAGFKVYTAETDGEEIPVVKVSDTLYRRAKNGETGVEIKVKDGKVRVEGFDNGTYYLQETTTPEGYNQLATRQRFIISDGNLDATFNNGIFSTGSGVHVINKSGTMLPETGAAGTMMFLTFGMFTVLATGVLLVTKKRMSMIEE